MTRSSKDMNRMKKHRKMKTKANEKAASVLNNATSASELEENLKKLSSNNTLSPEVAEAMNIHKTAEKEGEVEFLTKYFLDKLGFRDADKDPYGNGDQTMLFGMEAYKLQSQWGTGFNYNPADNTKLSDWCKACFFADIEKVNRYLNEADTKDKKTKLLERRESMIRFCGILHVICGARMDASENHIAIARLLIEAGCKLDVKDVAGYTPLHHCLTKYGNSTTFRIAEILVENGANVNAVNRFGCTPLFEPCMNLMYDFIEFLVSNGCDPQIKENNGLTCQSFGARNPKMHSIFSKGYRCQAKKDKKKLEGAENADESSCSFCGKAGHLKKCSACLSVSYCSRACQTHNWKDHKNLCKAMQETKQAETVTVIPVSNPYKNVNLDKDMLITFNEKSKTVFTNELTNKKYIGEEKAMKVKIQVSLGPNGAQDGPMLVYNKTRSYQTYIAETDRGYRAVYWAVVSKGYGGIKAYFAATLKKNGDLQLNLGTAYSETF